MRFVIRDCPTNRRSATKTDEAPLDSEKNAQLLEKDRPHLSGFPQQPYPCRKKGSKVKKNTNKATKCTTKVQKLIYIALQKCKN